MAILLYPNRINGSLAMFLRQHFHAQANLVGFRFDPLRGLPAKNRSTQATKFKPFSERNTKTESVD